MTDVSGRERIDGLLYYVFYILFFLPFRRGNGEMKVFRDEVKFVGVLKWRYREGVIIVLGWYVWSV